MRERRRPWWMVLPEWEMMNSGEWELVHDGRQNPLQFEYLPDEIRCFTRKYKRVKGRGLIESVMFRYDLRYGASKGDIVEIVFVSGGEKHTREVFSLTERRGRIVTG